MCEFDLIYLNNSRANNYRSTPWSVANSPVKSSKEKILAEWCHPDNSITENRIQTSNIKNSMRALW